MKTQLIKFFLILTLILTSPYLLAQDFKEYAFIFNFTWAKPSQQPSNVSMDFYPSANKNDAFCTTEIMNLPNATFICSCWEGSSCPQKVVLTFFNNKNEPSGSCVINLADVKPNPNGLILLKIAVPISTFGDCGS